jgi:hypothetical protein
MMLVFGIAHSIGLVFEHWAWIGSGFVAFLAYKAAAVRGYRMLPAVAVPKRLLLLRVFALGARSEPLFDTVRKLWLRGGYIAMIVAGPGSRWCPRCGGRERILWQRPRTDLSAALRRKALSLPKAGSIGSRSGE